MKYDFLRKVVKKLSWAIKGKWTRPDYWETVMFGWHAEVERPPHLNGMWQATIEPLVEPFKGSPAITSPQFFYGGNLGLGGHFDGVGWCYREILKQWSIVFAQWRKEPSFETNPLRQQIVNRLRQHELRSELQLIENGLGGRWGTLIEQQRQNVPELRDDEAGNVEPTILIWETVRDIGIRWPYELVKDVGIRWQGFNRMPQQGQSLTMSERYIEAESWAEELAQYPFYPTINIFSQAVIDWIQTCDLKPFLQEGDDEVSVMWDCLRVFDVDQL